MQAQALSPDSLKEAAMQYAHLYAKDCPDLTLKELTSAVSGWLVQTADCDDRMAHKIGQHLLVDDESGFLHTQLYGEEPVPVESTVRKPIVIPTVEVTGTGIIITLELDQQLRKICEQFSAGNRRCELPKQGVYIPTFTVTAKPEVNAPEAAKKPKPAAAPASPTAINRWGGGMGKKWGNDEVAALKGFHAAARTIVAMAEEHRRTVNAIICKLEQLELILESEGEKLRQENDIPIRVLQPA